MSIEAVVYDKIKAEITETYRKMSPTPGIGDYVVVESISEVTEGSKDISKMPFPGATSKMQAKVYGSNYNTVQSYKNTCLNIIRTTENHIASGLIWSHSMDDSVLSSYTKSDQRYQEIILFTIHYK